jgi:hypothetical protein
VDHIIARAAGGNNADDNLVAACFDCNAGKSDRHLTGAGGLPPGVKERMTKRRRPIGDPRNRSPHLIRKGNPMHHVLNLGRADGSGWDQVRKPASGAGLVRKPSNL